MLRLARYLAGQHLLHQGGERGGADGLESHGIRAVRAFRGVLLRAEQGQQDEGQAGIAWIGAHRRQKIEAAFHGHELIGEHQIEGIVLLELLPCFVDSRHRDGLEAGEPEFPGEAAAADGDIVDDEHAAAEADGLALQLLEHGIAFDGDPERRAAPGFAAHADLAAHQFGQALDDGQTQAAAAVVARGGGIDLREAS